ncbi:MAG: DegT/DnrJ/EryC1/StrS family aminotransferase [Nitrospirae bacterium]|nr:DegT/DnrJ/EryC1/StrS family aminotransferase [Nitrospirota bacterium]
MIPFAKPLLGEEEAAAASEAILSGWVMQGPKVKAFEDSFASCVGSKYACAVSSCTSALHMALQTVGVRPGDIVITVSHSFIATANSVRHCGAEPVFVDIEPDTFNMSADSLEKCLSEDCEVRDGKFYYRDVSRLAVGESPLRAFIDKGVDVTKSNIGRLAAVMPVHQLGMPCDLNAILQLAGKYNLPVVEDAACALGSEININGEWEKIGRPHGDIACFSFQTRKIITTGDGGMLTTNNADYDKRFRLLRNHGMGSSSFERHGINQVVIEQYLTTGYCYRMTDIQAAVGIEQLKKLDVMLNNRKQAADLYREKLKEIAWLKTPQEPDYCRTNWQTYTLMLQDNAPMSRDELMQRLHSLGIANRRGVMNAHEEPPYNSCKWGNLIHSEKVNRSSLLLPMSGSITIEQAEFVVNATKTIKNYSQHIKEVSP